MIELAPDAPGSIACGRSGLPLLAFCPNGHRRFIPFRLLKTSAVDQTPLYGRLFKCRACGSSEVTLYVIEGQAELDALQSAMTAPPKPTAPTTQRRCLEWRTNNLEAVFAGLDEPQFCRQTDKCGDLSRLPM